MLAVAQVSEAVQCTQNVDMKGKGAWNTSLSAIPEGKTASDVRSRSSPFFFWPSASPLGLRPPKSGRPAPNSPISSLSDCGFQPERTETARDLTKNPAVIEDTYTAVGTTRQLQDASRIIGVPRLWYEAESGVSLSVATGAVSLLTAEGPASRAARTHTPTHSYKGGGANHRERRTPPPESRNPL